MEKVDLNKLKYEDFINPENIYGIIYEYKVRNSHFAKVDNKGSFLDITLFVDDEDFEYSDYNIFLFDSLNEMQQYVDNLCKDVDMLHTEGFYQKETFEDEEDFEFAKNDMRYSTSLFRLDTDLDYIYPNIDYNKYATIVYSNYFETDFVELLEDVKWLLNCFEKRDDSIWQRTFDEVKENYLSLLTKFQRVRINNTPIDMHHQCINDDWCFGYKELLNKYDRLLNLIDKK